jgi:hypothetical protein
MHPPVKRLLGLRINVSLPDQAAEGGLDVGTGAAETIVQVEMAKSSVEIIAPKQGYHAAPEPDAFRIAGWAGQKPRRLSDFVDLFLAFLGRVGSWLLRFGRFAVAATLAEGGRTMETKETKSRHAAKHGKRLTQLESEPHCPRRMFDFGRTPLQSCVGPDWDANTAVIYLVNPPPYPAAGLTRKNELQELARIAGFCPA